MLVLNLIQLAQAVVSPGVRGFEPQRLAEVAPGVTISLLHRVRVAQIQVRLGNPELTRSASR